MKQFLIITFTFISVCLFSQTYPDTVKINVVESGSFKYVDAQEFIDSSDITQMSDTLSTLATKNDLVAGAGGDTTQQFTRFNDSSAIVTTIGPVTNTFKLRDPIKVVDIVDSIQGSYQVGTIIQTRGLTTIADGANAVYQVQADSVGGYVTDSIGVIPVGNNYAILQPEKDGFYNVKHFGVDTSLADNYTPFQKAYDFSKQFNKPIKIDNPGTYRFSTLIDDLNVQSDIEIRGVGNIIFQVDGANWGRFLNTVESGFAADSLLSPNLKGTDTLLIRNANLLSRGDLIAIEQLDAVPGVGTKRELVEVSTVLNDTTVLLLDSLLFNHIDTNSYNFIRVFKKRSFKMEGIKFDFKFNYLTTGSIGVNLWGFNGVEFRDVEFINDTYDSQLLDGASLYGCSNAQFENTKYRNLRYGSLINVSDRIRIFNAYAEDVRHLSAISTWTKNVYVSDVIAYRCRTPIEAHYGWNIHYNNIRSEQKGKITLRSFGELKITNSYIRTDNTEDISSIYSLIGYHFANDSLEGTEFEWLVNRTNILIDGVEYIETNRTSGVFTGLSATSFQNLTIRGSKASSMGAYENGVVDGSITKIENSTLGRLYGRNGGEIIILEDVLFDGDLNTGTSVLSHGQADTLIIRNALFLNCDTFHLEENWQANGAPGLEGEYQFHSVSGTLKSPALQVTTGAIATAKPMKFYNSDIIFVDTFVPQYLAENTEDLFQLSNSSIKWSDINLYDTYRAHTKGDEYFSFNNSSLQKIKIDSLGLTLNQNTGGYSAGVTNKNPVTGVLANDLHIYAQDRVEFISSGGSFLSAYINSLAFETDVRIITDIDPVDIHSIANEEFTIRAGDGNPVRTSDITFLVKDDQEALRITDSKALQSEGVIENLSATDVNIKTKIDSSGVYFTRPVTGLYDHWIIGNSANELELTSASTMLFNSNGAQKMRINNTAIDFSLPLQFIAGDIPAIYTIGNNVLTYRAGDGIITRTAEHVFTVKDDQEVIRFTDDEEVLINIADQGAYNLQVEGDGYFDDKVIINNPTGEIGDSVFTSGTGQEVVLTSFADITAQLSTATETTEGIVELATVAELDAGTDVSRVPNVDNLAGSDFGTKFLQIEIAAANVAVTTGDQNIGVAIPASLDGWDLVNAVATVFDKGITGTTDVTFERRRAGAEVDMLSTAITIGDEWFAQDGVIDAANDDVATGDNIYGHVDAIHSGTAPNGLIVVLEFRKP